VTDTVRIRFPALRNVLSLVWREADRFVKVRLITTCTRGRSDGDSGADQRLAGYQIILQALVFTVLRVVTELRTVVCRKICSKTGPSSAVEA
jgi:hypothetical protein